MKPSNVILLGEGELHRRAFEELDSLCRLFPEEPKNLAAFLGSHDVALILSVHDTWQPALHEAINQASLESGVPWLRCFVRHGEGILGPLVLPGVSGCCECCETRLSATMVGKQGFQRLKDLYRDEAHARADSWCGSGAIDTLARLLISEVSAFIKVKPSPHTVNAIYTLNLSNLMCGLHRFLPNPICKSCMNLPPDSKQQAYIRLQPRRKLSPKTLRVSTLIERLERWKALLCDSRTGLIAASCPEYKSDLFASSLSILAVSQLDEQHSASGRTLNFDASHVVGIAEALERYSILQPYGKRTVVRGSYHSLKDQALDPESLCLHSDEQYESPGFPFMRYSPDLEINWVWGYSFSQQRPILVPEQCVYLRKLYDDIATDNRFVSETSNGAAAGGCLEEAILHGILEIVERDAFLITWYGCLKIPPIDPFSAADKEIHLMLDKIKEKGYDFHAFDMTFDFAIPCLWAMVVNRNDDGRIKTLCVARAHLDMEEALKGVILELAAMIEPRQKEFQEGRQRALRLVDYPFEVTQLLDHSLIYMLPEVFGRFDFLFEANEKPRSLKTDYSRDAFSLSTQDLTADLESVLRRFLDRGMDVIAVDITTPEQALAELCAVKVVIPGTLPMSFGHQLQRLKGARRLYSVPAACGYASPPATGEGLNPHPHPFP
jgi:ribosomal protein S12 methylthiotransferase accessory factor